MKPYLKVTHKNVFSTPMTQQPLVGDVLLIVEASLSHSDTSPSVGFVWTSDKHDAKAPLPDNTKHSHETDIYMPGGIRNHNPTKRTTEDPPLDSVATGIG